METIIVGELPVDEVKTIIDCWTGKIYLIVKIITITEKGKCTDMVDTWRKYEVIGNIHSNPELLK